MSESAKFALDPWILSLADSLPMALYICDAPHGEIKYFNSQAAEFWGREPKIGDSDERFCGSFRLRFPNGEPLPHDQTPMATALREGRQFRNELVIIERPDGSLISVRVNINPIHDSAGKVIGAINAFQDVTELRRAEEELRDSEERFRLMADAAPVLIWVSDENRRGVYFNARWLKFTGRTLEQELGYGWTEAIHPDDRQKAEQIYRSAFDAQEPFRMEFRLRDGDGRYCWFLDHGVPRVSEHGLRGYIGSCIDITEQRETEKALRENEQRLQAILEVLPLPLFIADPDGRLQMTNRAAQNVWGEARLSEQASRYSEDYKGWWPDSGGEVLSHEWAMARALAKGEIVTAEEVLIETIDGRRRTILNYAGPIRDSDDRITGGVAMNVDITERKEAEARLLEADRRKDEFLAVLAHELRNPLAPLRSGVDAMKSAQRDPEQLETVRRVLERQVDLLAGLVDDLLDISRIASGRLTLRKQRVPLEDIVSLAVESAQPQIDKHEQHLTVEEPNDPSWLECDFHRVAQILSNLLSNAAKHNPSGTRIRLDVQRSGNELCIRVEDNGLGIPVDAQESIFDTFAQLPAPPGETQSGLGIGLALARSLAELHGGSISFEPREGSGSIFSLRLPGVVDEGDGWENSQEIAPPVGAKRILVADDNEEAAEMLSMLLSSYGNEVRIARDGIEAVELAGSFHPDIAFLDLGMPRMDGYEAAAQIRQNGDGRIQLVALTGWGQASARARTTEAGFDQHLVKPVRADALKRLLAGESTVTGV